MILFGIPLEIAWTVTVSWEADEVTCRIVVFLKYTVTHFRNSSHNANILCNGWGACRSSLDLYNTYFSWGNLFKLGFLATFSRVTFSSSFRWTGKKGCEGFQSVWLQMKQLVFVKLSRFSDIVDVFIYSIMIIRFLPWIDLARSSFHCTTTQLPSEQNGCCPLLGL